MKNIEINIGNLCNNECKFCMIDYENNRNFVQFETIKKEIIRAKNQEIDSIGFLGGEFTLHPDIFRVIKICKLLNFKIIHIISNGRKYADGKFLDKLIESGVNRFSVSIHSHREEKEDFLTQRKGGLKEKLKGLKNLMLSYQQGSIKNPISINIVINGVNYKDIIETLKFFNKLCVADFRLNFIWLHGRAQKFPELFLKYSDFLPYIPQIINLAKTKKFQVSFEGIPPCLFNKNDRSQVIGEYRDNNTEVVAYNNPQKQREVFNWQERKENEFKIKHPTCLNCQDNFICEGVWQDYIDKYGWDKIIN